MGREEQIEEREVLDSIFPDEINGIHDISINRTSANSSTDIDERSFKVAIALDSSAHDVEEKHEPRKLQPLLYRQS